MTGTAVKRKRFEGLIHFQEPLRQALVCIQAAYAGRFATAFQSEFIKARDTKDLSHFLLTSDGSDLGEVSATLEERHLLMAIEQLDDGQENWKKSLPEPDVKISAWLNTGDPLVCQQLYLLLAMAVAETSEFDLSRMNALGSIETELNKARSEAWMSAERISLYDEFQKDVAKIFKIDRERISTDGCSVSYLVEGETSLSAEDAFRAIIQGLKSNSRHLVIANYISGPKPRLQCVYLTPMRLPLKELQNVGLKGFVLLRDIKEKAAKQNSVLAS